MGDSPNIATFYTEDQPRDLGYFEPIPNGFVGIMPPVVPNTASTHSFTKDDCHTRVPTKSIQRLDWVKKTCAALVSLFINIYIYIHIYNYIYIYGCPEMGTGKSPFFVGFSIMNYESSIFGYPHFRKPTCKNLRIRARKPRCYTTEFHHASPIFECAAPWAFRINYGHASKLCAQKWGMVY